jgi:hypothetical protein
MCACLPAFRALIGRYLPSLLGNTTRRTYATPAAEYYHKSGVQSNINKSVTYEVNYTLRSETNSDVELVDVTGKRSL